MLQVYQVIGLLRYTVFTYHTFDTFIYNSTEIVVFYLIFVMIIAMEAGMVVNHNMVSLNCIILHHIGNLALLSQLLCFVIILSSAKVAKMLEQIAHVATFGDNCSPTALA